MIVLVPVLKHMTLTTNKNLCFLSALARPVCICFSKDITRELVTRVVGLDKTLPAKGALGFKKCSQCGVGGTLSN